MIKATELQILMNDYIERDEGSSINLLPDPKFANFSELPRRKKKKKKKKKTNDTGIEEIENEVDVNTNTEEIDETFVTSDFVFQ